MKNIRLFLQFCIFLAVVIGAVMLVPHLSQNLDKPYEAGCLSAPDIPHAHGAAHGEGHEGVEEGHGDVHGDAAATDLHAQAEKKTRLS